MHNYTCEGFLPLNKPKGISSFYCVDHIKKLLPKKIKVGHTGTLDTFASGLLIICIGRSATRLVGTLMNLDKTYQVKAKFGECRDTLDYTGSIVETKDIPPITKAALKKTIIQFEKTYEQIPPIYSALKHKGTPLYKLAREKNVCNAALEKIAQAKQRTVHIYHLALLDFSPPFFSFEAKVSKGTYIRSLANDIATKLDSVATTYKLTRTTIGQLTQAEAVPLADFDNPDTIKTHLIAIQDMKNMLSIQHII